MAGQVAERCFNFLMMKCIQLEHSDTIEQIKDDYLRTFVAPIDGMWENAVIAHATFWEIQDREQQVGYFCRDTHNEVIIKC